MENSLNYCGTYAEIQKKNNLFAQLEDYTNNDDPFFLT